MKKIPERKERTQSPARSETDESGHFFSPVVKTLERRITMSGFSW